MKWKRENQEMEIGINDEYRRKKAVELTQRERGIWIANRRNSRFELTNLNQITSKAVLCAMNGLQITTSFPLNVIHV